MRSKRMNEKEPLDEPRREKSNIDEPQEEFIDDGGPSKTEKAGAEKETTWGDSWRPEDKAMESAEKESRGIDQNDEEEAR